jgi:hypothetical protein
MWRWLWAVIFILGGQWTLAQDHFGAPPPADLSSGPALDPASPGALQPPNPYASVWPPPGGPLTDAHGPLSGPAVPAAVPAEPSLSVAAAPTPAAAVDRTIESSWYFREESFHWNERFAGADFVNEYGPLSTLGYQHRSGIERFRLEIFGGTVAYYGGAQLADGTTEPYDQSDGTNYIGFRGEYELLIEPAALPQIRFVAGLGTRFWFRDLQDTVLGDGTYVTGYQETWWTIYPYIGVETRESKEPGLHFYGLARVGATAFTYQYADYIDPINYPLYSDTVLYPRCGVTAQLQLGARYQGFSLVAYTELMTWGQSDEVRGALQPASTMFTIGGQVGYTF